MYFSIFFFTTWVTLLPSICALAHSDWDSFFSKRVFGGLEVTHPRPFFLSLRSTFCRVFHHENGTCIGQLNYHFSFKFHHFPLRFSFEKWQNFTAISILFILVQKRTIFGVFSGNSHSDEKYLDSIQIVSFMFQPQYKVPQCRTKMYIFQYKKLDLLCILDSEKL